MTREQRAAAVNQSRLWRAAENWLRDGRAQGWSPATLKERRGHLERVCWWLQHEAALPLELASLTPATIRELLAYAREPQPNGRWGTRHPQAFGEARPASVNALYRVLRAFTNFCREEGLLAPDAAPLKNVKAPKIPKDQIVPLAPEQVQALLDAARRGRNPERDLAIVNVLVDTGMREGELCGLTVGDIDRSSGELTVTGKGNKKRQVHMGVTARRALWRYLEAERTLALPVEPLLVSTGGNTPGAALTESGVYRVVAGLGRTARVEGVRCSPHTLRHTFAINFLRNGGNVLELQQILGHEDITVLQRYVKLAQVDIAQAHRKASPADRMKLR